MQTFGEIVIFWKKRTVAIELFYGSVHEARDHED
jgi:hypothetical protein